MHGTCVALGDRAALLRGGSGAGKSDLALRFLALPPEPGRVLSLVADDQVDIQPAGADALTASPPATLAGKLEVRGLGITAVPFLAKASLILVVDLVSPENVPRMPESAETVSIAGIAIPLLRLAPFEASAPVKLKLALLSAQARMPI